MRAILIIVIVAVLSAPAALAQQAEALARALEARAEGDWVRAYDEARASGRVGQDIITWHRLRSQAGTFEEAQAFLARRSDWPGLPYLRRQTEFDISPRDPAAEVLSYFAEQAPRTGNGSLRLAQALRTTGRAAEADAEIIRGWTTHVMRADEEAEYISNHSALIRPHHWARTDMLLWRGSTRQAERMLPLLSRGERTLVEARIALRQDEPGVTAKINAVPRRLSDDPGLAFERFLWRVKKGRTDDAIALLETTTELGNPEAWGNLRRRYARMLMRDDKDQRAYRMAAAHGLSEGRNFADLEWLAGYIALRKLDDADTALGHFERFEKAVDTPISVARALYWQGRAHAAVGNTDAAAQDFGRAANHQTAFYGQLAAEEIGVPMDPGLTGRESFPPWREAPFMRSSVLEASLLLLAAGDLTLGERFLTHLTESLDRTQVGQISDMARAMSEPHLEVMIAKRAVQYGMVVEGPYFPLHPLAEIPSGVPPELALAIARRESEFDPGVSSGVGARGLMQLMLPTAQEMASDLGVEFSETRLLRDADYNARLGLTYLAELQTRYGDSPVLISVAYNAGPSRADDWIKRFGDPRSEEVDIVDWIEHIPFRETRNYVMRVTESLPVYRARLSGVTGPLGLNADLRGAMPEGPVIGPAPPDFAPIMSLRPVMRPETPPAAPATE